MELEPEVHAHHHKSGHSRVDLLLALSALVLSVVSMFIAIENHHAMKQLVTANSWPYLRHDSSNVSGDGDNEIDLALTNAGIGPALIEKFTLSYQGMPIKNKSDLLLHCCVKDFNDPVVRKADIITGEMNGRAVSPREKVDFLKMRKPDQEPLVAMWEKLDQARFHLVTAVCYRSVFGEHWITKSDDFQSRQVDSCDALPGPAYVE
jgi:hypothetical protein